MHKTLLFVSAVLNFVNFAVSSDVIPPCFSEIYCHGRLLHTIQMARIYEDSKSFVDMKLKNSPNETLINFDKFMVDHNDAPNKAAVKNFVLENFDHVAQEFQMWDPPDWIEEPKFVEKIVDPDFREFALHLNSIWKKLGRKIKDEVKEHNYLYSIIWVPHAAIVPGGRFREFYYWDSYWIILGLLLSEMTETTKGMLQNFLYMVENYGHIPNGGRIYYLARSQPPFLMPMVKRYYDATKDVKFLRDNIRTMEKEFEYWMTNHNVTVTLDGNNYTLARYGDKSQGPRPESYSEDFSGAIHLNPSRKEEFYSELKAAAESGWDFSSRWFITNGTDNGNLTNIKTRSIIPVDLNAMLYWNAQILGDFNKLLNNKDKAEFYYEKAKELMDAVTAVFWHEEVGIWLDYDISNNVKRDYFYPTNLAPLLAGCYNSTESSKITKLVMKYLHNKHIMNYPGGIPTTMKHTGEQWDYPNAWPPMQYMMIAALDNTGDKAAQRLAFEIAQKWVRSNYKAFKATSAMLEKYDATVFGAPGSGGEYQVQEGFGWTNGLVMHLLDKYSDVMFVEDPSPLTVPEAQHNVAASSSSVTAVLIALLVSLTAGFIGICIYKRKTSQINRKIQSPVSQQRVRYTELKTMSDGR